MFKIKKINKKDLKKFVELWNQEFKNLTTSGFQMTYDKALKGFNEKMFDYWGIYLDNALEGFMLLKRDDDTLWVKHILVEKNLRGKGFGILLLNKASKQSVKLKISLQIEVLKSNQKALNFFLQNNFEIMKDDVKEDQYILKSLQKN